MKNHNEMYQSLLSRYEEHQEKKKKQILAIKRTAPVLACLCLTMAFGVGYWGHLKDLPNTPVQPDIIEESTTRTSDITTTIMENDTTIRTDYHTEPTVTTAPASKSRTDRTTTTTGKQTKTLTTIVTDMTETKVSAQVTAAQTEKQVPTVTYAVIQTTAMTQTTIFPTVSTVTETTTAVEDDSRILYPIGKTINIKNYKAMAAASYLIYNDLETSTITTDVTATTQTTTAIPSETTTTTVTTDDKQAALKKLSEKENRLFGEFQRERAVLLGELPSDAPRLTLDEAVDIIESSDSFAEICRKLHEAQPLVDYIGGSGITRLEYWFDDKGEQKIYLIMEEESIFYFRFYGADIVYS